MSSGDTARLRLLRLLLEASRRDRQLELGNIELRLKWLDNEKPGKLSRWAEALAEHYGLK